MHDELFKNLNELFQAKARLGIMTVLTAMGDCDFSSLKAQLGLTDGNLSTHLRVLEEAGYLQLEKKFIKRKPKTYCRLTPTGREAFRLYLEQLELIIRLARQEAEQRK